MELLVPKHIFSAGADVGALQAVPSAWQGQRLSVLRLQWRNALGNLFEGGFCWGKRVFGNNLLKKKKDLHEAGSRGM